MTANAGFRRVRGTTGRLFIPLLLNVLAGFAGMPPPTLYMQRESDSRDQQQ